MPLLGVDPQGNRSRQLKPTMVRRRGSVAQGRALEALGHAVEYLVDMRMFDPEITSLNGDPEAIRILMRLSRSVFEECPAVQPASDRLRRWLSRRLPGVLATNQQS